MINWKRCVYGNKIRLIDVDGDVFDGIVESVIEVQERSDLEKPEDGLDIILVDGQHIHFYESEIKSVSRRYDEGEIIDIRIIPQADSLKKAV